ncbi:FHA domain-containing protein [Brachymonas sp. M4Q-1]|uniref:FHA domain-containing protein n=1 Tax=Brachymonas sp. M4Q-1 TaxID=3416906 RepID=UPI003CF222F4
MAKLVITLDGVVIREVPLDKDHISLGRRPYNHIVIDNLAVSGDHCVFQYVGGQFYVEDVDSTNGTSVNGLKIKRQKLQNGDIVGVAKYRIEFLSSPEDALRPPRPTGVLNSTIQVISGPATGRSLVLTKPVTTVGKPGVAVASISRRAESFVLRYIEGTRPMTCNGNTVATREHILLDGDLIDLAGVQMRFAQHL